MLLHGPTSRAQESETAANKTYPIDLPTALRLAGAQNLDVQIARQKLAEARANQTSAVLQFFPSVSPGGSYRRHDNLIQGTDGSIVDVHKQSYAPGANFTGQIDFGEAMFKTLATEQLANSAGYGLESQKEEAVLAAATGYFDLALANATRQVALDAVKISESYQGQLQIAFDVGIAFKGDLIRVKVQAERNQLSFRQAREQERIAAARLAQTLNLDPAVELSARDSTLLPITLVPPDASLDSLIKAATASSPELKQSRAFASAASRTKYGAILGPLFPSVSAQAFLGELSGGKIDDRRVTGNQRDYFVSLSWRVGPGGLFDFGRIRLFGSRLKAAEINAEKTQNDVVRQVLETFAKVQSLNDQIHTTQAALAAAEEGLRLAQERREFGVGVVLENIQAEQDFTRARVDYFKTIAEFNKAQYQLYKTTGKL